MPYSYGFENNNLATDGWLLSGATSDETGISSDAAQNGSCGFAFNYDEQNAYLLSPIFTGNTAALSVTFSYTEYSDYYGDEQFYVGYTTDASNTDPTTYTYGAIVTASTSWQEYENTFPAGTKRIAIKYVYNDCYYLYLDDFTFEVPSSCAKPTALAASNITATGATLNWTSTNAATTTYTITDGDAIDITTDPGATSYSLTSLTPGTTYSTLTITANCGGSDHSDPVNVPSFSTAYGIPFAQSFGASAPTGWIMRTGLLNENAGTGTATLTGNSGWSFGTGNSVFDNHARCNIYDNYQRWLILPAISMEDNVQLTFDLALTKYSGSDSPTPGNQADDKFIVLASTDNMETWTVLRKWDNAGSAYVYDEISNSATGQAVAIDLSAYDGQSVIIAFYGESTVEGGDNNLHIDNVSIDYIPNCAKPTGLAKSNVAAHQVDLSWTKGDAETDWDICINDNEGALVSIDENDVTITGSSVSYTLTGLVSETPYTVKVRANCGGSNGVSQWSNVVSFTTTVACPAPTSPSNHDITAHTATLKWFGNAASSNYEVKYRTAAGVDLNTSVLDEDFTGLTAGIPTGWDNSEGTTTNSSYKWNYYNSGHDAAPCVRFDSYNNGNGKTNFLKTPAMDFPAGKTMVLSFWWKNPAGDDFSVYISTDGGTTQTPLKTGMTGQSSWKQESISLSDYVGATNVTIHFKGTSNCGYGDAYIYLDDIMIAEEIPAGDWQTVAPADITFTPGTNVGAASLSGLLAETKYEAYVRTDCNAAGDGYSTTQLDFTPFTTDIACKKPTTLAADATGATTVTLSWTNGEAGQTAWVIAHKAEGAADFTEVAADANPFTVTGLTPATTYSFKVRANCTAASDGYSDWSDLLENVETQAACPTPVLAANGITNITDNSATVTWTGFNENQSYVVSYRTAAYLNGTTEEFGSSLPTGWTRYGGLVDGVVAGTTELNTTSISSPAWSISSNAFSTYNATLNIYGSSCNRWFVSPEVTLPNGSVLNFDLALTDYNNSDVIEDNTAQSDDRFAVLIYANDAWTILREWNNSGSSYVYNNIPANGENVQIDLSSYSGTVKIAFYGESTVGSNGDNDIHIDNVAIGVQVAAGGWQTVSPNPTTTTTTLTGLTPETKYDVKVQANCAASQTSGESEVRSFTTYYGATLDVTANSWYAIASPVHNSGNDETVAGVDNLIATDPVKYDFLRYNEQYAKWESQKDDGFDAMERGRGHIYRRSAATTLKFIGERNTGNITYFCQGASSGTMKGWNLIGNPYPHEITRAHISQAYGYLVSGYYTLQTSGSWRAEASTTAPIAVGQAILVKVTYGGNVTFSETAPATKSAPASTIAFTVSNDEFTDIAYARFSSEEGLPKISHLNPEAPMLSIDGYAIANLNEGIESFPMSFSGNGEYTLTVSGNTNVTGYLHLVDRLTGRDIDLLSTPSYSFTGSPVSDRFTVKLTPDANEGNSTTRFAIFDGNSLIVNGEGTLEVYDVMGRRLMSAEVTGSEYRIPGSDLHTGVYVLRMNGNSQKIVIK